MQLEQGKNYLVRTVTDHWLGELASVDGPYTVTLTRASWIADTGVRLGAFLRNGVAPSTEAEMVGDVTCQWLAVIPWPHGLPTRDQP